MIPRTAPGISSSKAKIKFFGSFSNHRKSYISKSGVVDVYCRPTPYSQFPTPYSSLERAFGCQAVNKCFHGKFWQS